MEIIRGKNEDSTLFFYKGFKYLEVKLCKRVARCSSRKLGCKATLHFIQEISVIEDFENVKEGTDFYILKEHTDFEDTHGNVWARMKEVMKKKAVETNEKLIVIFNDVSQT